MQQTNKLRAKFTKFTILLLSLCVASPSFAAQVKAVKGDRVLLDISGIEVQPGAQFYLLNAENKKTAIVEIKQVKNDQAVAEVTRGTALVGETLLAKSTGAPPSAPADNSQAPAGDSSAATPYQTTHKKMWFGALVSYDMNSFSMNIGPLNSNARDSASLTGKSISFKGYVDYNLNPRWTIRGATGLETFSATGSITHPYCNGGTSTNCSVNFGYLPAEGSIHFNYLTNKTRAWVGAGGALLFQVTASNNIPNLSTTSSTNQVLLLSTGVDIQLGPKHFIPLVLEYGNFPGSSITASSIYLRAGYGFN